MIFASPPEDDIDWADMHPEAMVKFLGRVWRIAADVAEADHGHRRTGVLPPATPNYARSPNRTIDGVTRQVEAYHLNVAVARLMGAGQRDPEGNRLRAGRGRPGVREAAEVLTVLVSLFAPYTAEEAWQLLGHKPSVARATWPAADQALLTQEKVTCVGAGQRQGPRQARSSRRRSGEDELRELALVAPGVVRTLGDQRVSRVIVRAPKLVSIVAA